MKIPSIIHESWHKHLEPLFQLESMRILNEEILVHGTFYPDSSLIFRVFRMPLHEIKIVILAQDPYPKRGQANGLAMSINPEVKITKTLQIVYRELLNETLEGGLQISSSIENWQTLHHWVDQGVFLFNTALTVGRGESNSHSIYWHEFIAGVIDIIAREVKPIWLLWGKNARDMGMYIFRYHEEGRIRGSIENRTMSASHPVSESYSPRRGGFYGCNHFLKVNKLLIENGKQAINW
jgi:uracil-DNA glycosylase